MVALAMDETGEDREALAAEGYTGPRGALAFCAGLVVVGALTGSVLFAILLLMLDPAMPESVATVLGTAAGGVLGLAIALVKIRRGNREAREAVEERAWKRHLRRELGR